MIGDVSFTETWEEIVRTGTITAQQAPEGKECHTIAFNLAVLKEANNYYFDDIVFKVKKLNPVTKLIGDVNGDGFVNVTDVSIAVDYVLNGNTEFIILENADMNEDGDVNITDISALVNLVLGTE